MLPRRSRSERLFTDCAAPSLMQQGSSPALSTPAHSAQHAADALGSILSKLSP